MKKNCKVILLLTNNPKPNYNKPVIKTEIIEGENKNRVSLSIVTSPYYCFSHIKQANHLYILSDDEIKEGDWFLYKNSGKATHTNDLIVSKCIKTHKRIVTSDNLVSGRENCKKIIATTDHNLKLPNIPIEFIKSYCNNPVDEVEVEYNGKGELCPGSNVEAEWCETHLKINRNNTINISNIDLPKQSVKDFLKPEFIFKRGDRVLVSNNNIKWFNRIYLTTIDFAYYPFAAVRGSDELNFSKNELFNVISWKYIKPLKEETVEVTIEEVAKKLGIDPKQLRIKDK